MYKNDIWQKETQIDEFVEYIHSILRDTFLKNVQKHLPLVLQLYQ
jgi:hypothetical protein